jgi:predicted type IV restriction endonuclease
MSGMLSSVLETDINDIKKDLVAGLFPNEAAVSQGILLRILHGLKWPTYNTQVVCPEFAIESRRVDFALCPRPNEPMVFVEVKQVGQGEGADRQLFEYAFHIGVPLAILTDGREWHFYLPAERGQYNERRFYKLDIIERDTSESAYRLKRYLQFDDIRSGEALERARADYRDAARDRIVESTLPEAWARLVAEGETLLIDLIAEKVEDICGFKPEPDMVAQFLVERVSLVTVAGPPPRGSRVQTDAPTAREQPAVLASGTEDGSIQATTLEVCFSRS